MRKELFKLIERNSVEIEESEKNGIIAHHVEVDDLLDDLEKLFAILSVIGGAKSYLRGHKIEYKNNEWIYSDNKQPTSKTYKNRACGKCDKPETKDGHDACLGTLKGVMNACCGHGTDEAYIQFLDGHCIRGKDAEGVINMIKKYYLF
jgi:hypothetical protein